ncbi:sporulation protein YunB [Flavonifractor sp. AGMB03687]|uniref:sporulation protein YunB n=1 Tax=Flavonifractor sp. AGMB03687 TaxID=2785133 RepID=UPI001AE076AA|nr:sporulation protein YunB [Flavonifractor sp. AGMB03687]
MGRPLRTYLPRRRSARRRQGSGLLLAAAVGIGLALLVIWMVDAALRPAVTTLASVQAENKITGIINDAVSSTLADQGVAYADLVTVERDESGKVSLVAVDSVKLNSLRTQILEQVLEQVEGLDAQELGVPLGSLTGFATASDWGPVLPVGVLTAAVPKAEFSNQFTAQGINQTLHQIMLDVTVELTLLIPGGRTETSVTAQVCVAETLLVGEVPQTYLGLSAAGS